jgi:hypothetical protein
LIRNDRLVDVTASLIGIRDRIGQRLIVAQALIVVGRCLVLFFFVRIFIHNDTRMLALRATISVLFER